MRVILAAILATTAVAGVSAQMIPTTPQMPGQAQPARVTAGTYQVDPAHTQVAWEVNHMGISMLEGLFPASSGSLTIDPKNPNAAKVDITFQVDQLSVTAPAFANHLKSDQIFNVAQFPTARFVSTSVVATGTKAKITGNLTIKGITKPVVLDATFMGAGDNPMSKKLNIGFGARTTIKRSDFGVDLAAPIVSDTVNIHIHAAFTAA
ncbi:YceI family protein [Sphingomonas aracearum]|uniref:Polyisoprenoid-binding protein n=1 Tax=Sphingomonas aracearum TaxID=2283317 RepID=A0A369VYX2_9SPHN|nr:YceI family protein [Sphingomonas aracearum]RDE06825.1 polyisoprenoid-binding protein [Sphingomonas aracearum]